MPDAWDITTGSSSVIVAVVDIGTEYTHLDLRNNIWAGIGWDFYDGDNDPSPFGTDAHGTEVAGVIIASLNNLVGVSGIAGGWGTTKGVSLMVLRAGKGNISGNDIDNAAAAQAIDYAAQHGANVINLSWNSLLPDMAIQAAIDSAVTNHNVLIVVSSGNSNKPSGVNTVAFPANLPNTLAVGATFQNGF